MGYVKHDAIICTAWDIKYLRSAHAKASKLLHPLVTEIIPGVVNGQVSFLIAPDGSKEGWEESNSFDEKRQEFLTYLKEQNGFVDYVAVRFGGDDDAVSVHSGSYVEES